LNLESDLLRELIGEEPLDPYNKLPASIRGEYTRTEWLWLSDKEKRDLVVNECNPTVFDE
jgi:hypothetical protein